VPLFRLRNLPLAGATLLAILFLLASLPGAAAGDSPSCPHKRLTIVAHEDDDLIFQNPAILEAIAAGDCVRTVYVTAGDAGKGETYWRDREQGPRAAYAQMAAVANSWTNSTPSVAGHTIHLATLTAHPQVSQANLRLPDGGGGAGTGYAVNGNQSVPRLWRSQNPQPASLAPISSINAIDGSATYTYGGLLATLEALIEEFEPDVIGTQNFNAEFGSGDHGDHIAVARFVHLAEASYAREHLLRSYMDYESKNQAQNVFEPVLGKKLNAYYAYAVHDSNEACASQAACESPFYAEYWSWLKRQYVVFQRAVPGANAGSAQAVASQAQVTLDGSGSSDPLGHSLSYEWTQTGGPAVTLSNSHAIKPTFTAPTGPATLSYSLVVKSTEASSAPDPVTVTVAAPPKFALTVTTSGNGAGTVASSPAGISCPADCEGSYDQGTKVTLTPSPAAGSEFKGWSGACAGTGSCEVTLGSTKAVGAEFALQRHALTVAKSGTGAGTVSSAPAGINCGAACSASFDHGVEVTLTASPAAGSEFKGWSGACAGAGSCAVSMSAAKSVGAEFALQRHALTVAKSGSGSGTVTSTPTGINCGATCSANFDHGTLVKLAGASAAGSKAVAWSGCDKVNAAGECEVAMSAAKAVSAVFDLESHQLTVAKSGTGAGTITSSPAGISCGAACGASFDHGTEVTLTASPAAGSEFKGWSGACAGAGSCVVSMSAAKEVIAQFALELHQLTVIKSGSGSGTVTSAPAGINCGATCSANFDHGALVKLTGTPGASAKAVVWEACPGTVNASNQCEVAMSQARSATARFDLEQHALTVTKGGSGTGTVTSAPAGISCGATCSASFDHGALVKLTGTPGPNSEPVAWESCPGTVNASNQCEVAMSAAKAAVAVFDLESHSLTVTKSGSGAGTVTSAPAGISCGAACSASFDHGTEVTLSASPTAGSEFKGWSGACAGAGSCVVSMSAAKSVGAEFAPVPKFALAVTASGNGAGTVASSPAGISCPTDCEGVFEQGTKVTLAPSPAAGSEFKGWSGACSGTGSCEVTMSAARSVGAEFALQRHQLTVTKSGTGAGTISSSPAGISCGTTCVASFDHGTEVTLTASPAAESKFMGWSGCDQADGTECNVTMNAAGAVTATFSLIGHNPLTVTTSGSGDGTVTSAPAGIDCGSQCSTDFAEGTSVILTGTSAEHSKTVVWEACPGTVNTSNQCEVTMSQARSATARFDLEQHALTVTKGGSGTGTVTSAPAGISCGAACSASFDHGTLVKLTGTPGPNSEPVAWESCPGAVNASNQCEVTMSAAKAASAVFDLESHSLTVTKSGSGAGTVTSSPAGINCGAKCASSFSHGALVKLTGASGAGSKAVTWSGCDKVNAAGECEVAMSAAKAVTAVFDLEQHSLTVTKSGSGAGTVSSSPAGISCGATCSASFDHGTEVTLTASPAAGSEFKGWSGACAGSGSCVVSMSAAKSVGAEFAPVPKFALKVSLSGNGSGSVSSAPAGIECGSDCEQIYEQGQSVTLSASPAPGSEFKGWSGGGCSGTGSCVVSISGAEEVSAQFTLQRHALTVAKSGSGSGTVSSSPAGISCGATCSASFDHGVEVTLTASPAADSEAADWTGCDRVNGANECEVAMSAAKGIVATFSALDHNPLTVTKTGSGTGTVTASPAGIECGAQCAAEYLEGTLVTLTGVAGAHSQLAWEACPGTVNASNQCEVSMTEARDAVARFDLDQHTLTVIRDGAGAGTATSAPAGISCGPKCTATFEHGTVVTLTMAADEAGTIAWSGCDEISVADECKVAMTADREVSATVTPPPVPPVPALPVPVPAPTPETPAAPGARLLKAKIGPGSAKFVFAARGSATKFRCALARPRHELKYKPCSSPTTYRNLKPGRYVFKVKAVSPEGAAPAPVTKRFKVPVAAP
jgi:LmbE family N-acetylglucosaminyl deacetylase